VKVDVQKLLTPIPIPPSIERKKVMVTESLARRATRSLAAMNGYNDHQLKSHASYCNHGYHFIGDHSCQENARIS
jgi:hypothetical protein